MKVQEVYEFCTPVERLKILRFFIKNQESQLIISEISKSVDLPEKTVQEHLDFFVGKDILQTLPENSYQLQTERDQVQKLIEVLEKYTNDELAENFRTWKKFLLARDGLADLRRKYKM